MRRTLSFSFFHRFCLILMSAEAEDLVWLFGQWVEPVFASIELFLGCIFISGTRLTRRISILMQSYHFTIFQHGDSWIEVQWWVRILFWFFSFVDVVQQYFFFLVGVLMLNCWYFGWGSQVDYRRCSKYPEVIFSRFPFWGYFVCSFIST